MTGAAALAAVPAAAQDKKVIIGTWGGDYSRLLTKKVTPLVKGFEVVMPRSRSDPRKAKMMAEKGPAARHGDVQGLSANDMYEMDQQGLVEQLDYSKMPNAANLMPTMKYAYGIGHIYSGKVVLYNPDMMSAPTGFADTLDPKHGNKLGIIDIQRQYNMVAAAPRLGRIGAATSSRARSG
jgi:putative spermidine/putrescine transport system substrate-binding protein